MQRPQSGLTLIELMVAVALLALLTVIYYAAVDLQQTWLWAVSGIVTGVAILVVFAVFEKQRQNILIVIEKLTDWQ